MARKYPTTFAGSALKDLEEIRTWYADQQASQVGERLVGEIVSHVERLANCP